MTIMEKAAYLRGLCDGMDFQEDSREAKLWGVLTELLSDVVHEIEDLKAASVDMSETLDDVCQDVALLEEMADDLDMSPFDDSWGDDDEDGYDGVARRSQGSPGDGQCEQLHQ